MSGWVLRVIEVGVDLYVGYVLYGDKTVIDRYNYVRGILRVVSG